MVATKETVIAQALALTDSDRAEVIDRLSASLLEPVDPEIEKAWDAELDRRLDNIAEGRAEFANRSEARARIVGDAGASQD